MRRVEQTNGQYHGVRLEDVQADEPLTAEEVLNVLRAYVPGEPIRFSLPVCVNMPGRMTAGFSIRGGLTFSRKTPCGNREGDCRPCQWRSVLERGLKVWKFVLARGPGKVHLLRLPDDLAPYDALRTWALRGGHWFQGLLQSDGSWLYVLSSPWSCTEHHVASQPCELSATGLLNIVVALVVGSDSSKDRRRKVRGSKREPDAETSNPLGTVTRGTAQHRSSMLVEAGIPFVPGQDGEPRVDAVALVAQGSDFLRQYGLRTASLPQWAVDQLIEQGERPDYARLGVLGPILRNLVVRRKAVSLDPRTFTRTYSDLPGTDPGFS